MLKAHSTTFRSSNAQDYSSSIESLKTVITKAKFDHNWQGNKRETSVQLNNGGVGLEGNVEVGLAVGNHIHLYYIYIYGIW